MTKKDFMEILEKLSCDRKAGSARERAVMEYRKELVEQLAERADYEGRAPKDARELKAWALNGASSWTQYSYDGNSCVYTGDIAERLLGVYDEAIARGCDLMELQGDALRKAYLSIEKDFRYSASVYAEVIA